MKPNKDRRQQTNGRQQKNLRQEKERQQQLENEKRKLDFESALRYDPTDPSLMRTISGTEIPPPDFCHYLSGTRHPTAFDLSPLTMEPGPGSLRLPATIALVNQSSQNPLARGAIYGQDLVWQSEQRAMHTMVFGPTGAGKNTRVIDPLRFSAIADPKQTVVSFSLKSSDYGPVRLLCKKFRKPLYVINLNDADRSLGWNPLDVESTDEAVDVIRRYADAVKNPAAEDSEFWNQWIKTGMTGGWEAGFRAFPYLYKLFTLPNDELVKTLKGHSNPSSKQLASFLDGRSHNAETVLASIVGAMSSFLTQSVVRIMSSNELKLNQILRKPVCLHIEIAESRLETLLVLYQMFARAVTDELIDIAERYPRKLVPATLFYDDLPSLGRILTPARMMTMRSRGIGTVCGVQSLSSLETIYGSASRALIDNVHTKIVLPGGVAGDAEFFSHSTGMQMVALPTYENHTPIFVNRPLLSGADIRTPNYQHPLMDLPATFVVGPMTFQAYLHKSYEHPEMAPVLHAAKKITGREKLRRKDFANTSTTENASKVVSWEPPAGKGFTNTQNWSDEQVRELLEKVKKHSLDWDNTTGSARKWWLQFEESNKTRLALVLRLAEELQERKATVTDFFLSYVYSNTDNIQANLHYLDYKRLRKAEEEKKKKLQDKPKDST